MPTSLPVFGDPPVVEVALSVQFEPIAGLCSPQLGLLWRDIFRDAFPHVEEHAPLDPLHEQFDAVPPKPPRIQIEMLRSPPTPRCWFLAEDRRELVQVQKDRFGHNWRKIGEGDAYPRFERIRKTFKKELEDFQSFVERENLGAFQPNCCEVTYVNHIAVEGAVQTHGQLGRLFGLCAEDYSDDFLPEPDELQMAGSFPIRETPKGSLQGRLRFSAEPAFRRTDNQPIFLLNMVARGNPLGDGVAGVLKFMDIGHEWIVRGFASMTTPDMHKTWRRTT